MMNEDQLRVQLEAVYSSTSWKVTAPLRFFSKYINVLKRIIFNGNIGALTDEDVATDIKKTEEDSLILNLKPEASRAHGGAKLDISPRANQLLREFEWRQIKK